MNPPFVKVFVCGTPVGQPRPRARRFKDRVIIYDPKTAKPWREAVSSTVARAVDTPRSGPLELVMTFQLPRPKSHYGTGKNKDLVKKSAPQFHSQKSDIDNIIKSTLDAMNGVLYKDDAQVSKITAQKVWADFPELAGLALEARTLELLED